MRRRRNDACRATVAHRPSPSTTRPRQRRRCPLLRGFAAYGDGPGRPGPLVSRFVMPGRPTTGRRPTHRRSAITEARPPPAPGGPSHARAPPRIGARGSAPPFGRSRQRPEPAAPEPHRLDSIASPLRPIRDPATLPVAERAARLRSPLIGFRRPGRARCGDSGLGACRTTGNAPALRRTTRPARRRRLPRFAWESRLRRGQGAKAPKTPNTRGERRKPRRTLPHRVSLCCVRRKRRQVPDTGPPHNATLCGVRATGPAPGGNRAPQRRLDQPPNPPAC
jgi:hypothetical protein